MHDSQATSKLARFVVEAGLVAEKAAMEVARGLVPGKRLAELLVLRGVVAADKLAQALSYHLGLPWVSLRHVNFSPRLVQMMPADVAGSFGVVPIYIRQPLDESVAPTLFVATDDPTNPETMRACARACGLAVRVMVATAPEVTIALAREFGIGEAPEGIWDEPLGEVVEAGGSTGGLAGGISATLDVSSRVGVAAELDAIDVVDIDEVEVGRGKGRVGADDGVYSGLRQASGQVRKVGQAVLRRAGGEDFAPCVVVGTSERDFLRRCRVAARRFAVRVVQASNEQQAAAFRERRPLIVLVEHGYYDNNPIAWSTLAVELGCPLSVLRANFDGSQAGSFIGFVLSKYESRFG